jgi:hypothetical protein
MVRISSGREVTSTEYSYFPIRPSSDAGLLLIRQADNALGLIEKLADCIVDRRDARYADHDLKTLLRQRVYQIVAGYEDCNDGNLPRKDPAMKAA